MVTEEHRAIKRRVRRAVLALVAAGALVQIGLSAYYLGVGHAPAPHDLPVGYIAESSTSAQVKALIEEGGAFKAREYSNADDLTRAIERKQIYGGVDVFDVQHPHLYIASAAGTTASNTIRAAFTAVVQRRVADQVQQLLSSGEPVPPSAVAALTAPPEVTDVVPLPDDDRAGSSLGFLVQALALGATIASIGLGRIGERTKRSVRRGIGHVGTLAVYAAVSAAAVLWASSWFGIIPADSAGTLFLDFLLLSLAITASTAAAVALVGPAGALVGTLYFTLGLVISGSSILPEFLPDWGRIVGQSLPTGAGVTAIRESLYFPDASSAGPLVVLSIYAAVGLLVVLATNLMPNRTAESSVLAAFEEGNAEHGDIEGVPIDDLPIEADGELVQAPALPPEEPVAAAPPPAPGPRADPMTDA